jgi:selenocysteine lyase/cysteine desulfurase
MDAIQSHVDLLTTYFLNQLSALEGVAVYGPKSGGARGNTVAFNLYHDGVVVPFEEVECAARIAGIALRGGCFCNPGAAEAALEVPALRARSCMLEPDFSIRKMRDQLGGSAVGATRASFGPANNRSDVDRVIDFLRDFAESSRTHSKICTSARKGEPAYV